MNLKLKAAGEVAGVSAFIFGFISLVSFVTKEYAALILGFGMIFYLMYLVYSIRLGQLEDQQRDLESVENIVRLRNKISDLEQKSVK